MNYEVNLYYAIGVIIIVLLLLAAIGVKIGTVYANKRVKEVRGWWDDSIEAVTEDHRKIMKEIKQHWKRECVRRGFAGYDKHTGEWDWLELEENTLKKEERSELITQLKKERDAFKKIASYLFGYYEALKEEDSNWELKHNKTNNLEKLIIKTLGDYNNAKVSASIKDAEDSE